MSNRIKEEFLQKSEPVRLNKYLSEAGVCSRREADRLIETGRVTVDGQRAQTGMRIVPGQVVKVGNKVVSKQDEMIVLAVNKPRGIVCTEERRERDSIVRFLNYPVRVTYIGRLDKDSHGLLLMTNNGDIINKMMRAANKHEKEYKVTVDNDTRAMTYGEYMQGCVKGEKDIIFVNVSWGVGIGIIIDGKIYTGKSGFSGEFGHMSAYDNEIICHCGKKGCLETEASGSALHRILLERIQSGESSILSTRITTEENPITLDEIIAAVNKEDLLCIEIVEEIGQKLGKQIAGLINIFNPELVIIGGTLSLTGDYITQPIKTAVRKYSLNLVNKDSAIITSKLKDKAGIVGACMLARSRMFES